MHETHSGLNKKCIKQKHQHGRARGFRGRTHGCERQQTSAHQYTPQNNENQTNDPTYKL